MVVYPRMCFFEPLALFLGVVSVLCFIDNLACCEVYDEIQHCFTSVLPAHVAVTASEESNLGISDPLAAIAT